MNMFWNTKKQSIRGSSVNLVITFTILILIVIGAFVDYVADNLVKIYPMINMFFVTSLGIWSYKKIKEGGKEDVE